MHGIEVKDDGSKWVKVKERDGTIGERRVKAVVEGMSGLHGTRLDLDLAEGEASIEVMGDPAFHIVQEL